MKAILVIDIPNGYKTDEVLIDYVLHTTGEYKVLRKCGNHGVRPMPQKMRTDADDIEEDSYYQGWNDCIEEIEK